MSARAWSQWVAVAVIAIVVLGSLGLVGAFAGVPAAPAHSPSTAASSTSPASSPTPVQPATITSDPAQIAGEKALAAAQSTALGLKDVFPPRASATPAELAEASQIGHVTPLYTATPAPMGLAEYGLESGVNGTVSPFTLQTTAVQGTFDPSAFGGPNATDLADSSPDGYGVQLNAVVTNVTLFGNSTYSFWTQNVIEYYPYAGEIYLITNVWNFSSPASYLSPNVFYQHGPFGTQVGTEYYYAFLGPLTGLYYPFNVTFTMVSSVIDGRNAVNFSLVISNTTGSPILNATNYDYVIFNSTAPGGTPVASPALYTASGTNYNPLGLTNDFELTIGGPGGGSQTTFLSANAQESLSYWDSTTDAFQAVPSAYSYGGETGETSVGAGTSWATGTNGQPYGILSTAPSLLSGLWNASSPIGGPGALLVNDTPGNAFVLISFTGNSSSDFNVTEQEWTPLITTGLVLLPAGTYTAWIGLSDYNSTVVDFTITADTLSFINVSLDWNYTAGVYTPLWAWTNDQIGAISTSGDGSQGSPYQVVNNQNEAMSFFGVLNDYGFPVFPGVYFLTTTAYTVFNNAASLEVNTTGAGSGGHAFPDSNNLPYWFYNDANIVLANSTISGWFSSYAWDYPYFLTFNVEFWNSTNVLVYNNSFYTQASALLLYNGFSSWNPLAIGGSVVWGNTFIQALAPGNSTIVVPPSYGIGLSEQENGDLIYNNAFLTPTTAVTFPTELYVGYYVAYFDIWNITPQAASNVNNYYNVNGFPMSGSVIGTSQQGGNYWWDYGLLESPYSLVQAAFAPQAPNSNPYGVLPYNEAYWMDPFGYGFGDYAPLTFTPLYNVTLQTDLQSGVVWTYTVTNFADATWVYDLNTLSSPSDTILLPSYPVITYQVNASAQGFAPISLTFQVTGNQTVLLNFTPSALYTISFTETGLPNGTAWVLQFNGIVGTVTGAGWLNYTVPAGIYSYSTVALLSGWTGVPASGTIDIQANQTFVIEFTPYIPTYSVFFTASGLWSGTAWNVTFNGRNYTSTVPTLEIDNVASGTYNYSIGAPAGYTASPVNGTITVANAGVSLGISFAPITFTVTFTESGLASGTWWAVSLGGVVYGSNTDTITFTVTAGTYAYLVGYISGESANPDAGSVTVGPSTTITIVFT